MSSGAACTKCGRNIDAAAKLCPYCGANPRTGERLDTQSILQEVFRPRRELTASENVMEYARQRQGVVIAVSAIVAFLLLAVLHQFITIRNTTVVNDSPAVPLTEVADLANRTDETAPIKMPPLDFQYDGKPQAMRTYIVERGAITPPEVVATQPPATQQQRPSPPPR